MRASYKQDSLEEQIIEHLLIERAAPATVMQALFKGPNPPDPLEAVFALTTVAADLSDWMEPGMRRLSDRCFEQATLSICELWVAGYRLELPKPALTHRPDQTTAVTVE